MKKSKSIWNFASNILIAILIILILLIAIPKIFGVQMRAVVSPSMEPELPVGALVIAVPKEYDDIQVGQDIMFIANEQLLVVTHRVVEKNEQEQTLTTQGLKNRKPDGPVMYKDVLGVVKLSIPIVGYVAMWLDSLAGKIITIILILALLIIFILFGKLKEITEEDKNEKSLDKETLTKQ